MPSDAASRAASPTATAQPPVTVQPSASAGRLDRVTRRFLDADLEAEYQREAGRQLRESVGLGQLFGGLLWLGALLILPQFAPVDTTLTTLVIVGVWLATLVGYLIMRRLEMLDDLQAIVLVLNVISMAAALAIATLTPGLQHQAAPAVIVVAEYAFIVLRLRFAFAVVLAIIHVAAFAVFTVTRLVPTAFALELFLVFAAAATGVLAAWYLETGGRQVFAQRRIIEAQAEALAVEKQKSDDLLLNVLPGSVAQKLRNDPDALVAEAHDVDERAVRGPRRLHAARRAPLGRRDGRSARSGCSRGSTGSSRSSGSTRSRRSGTRT